jgi:hypothetical protein
MTYTERAENFICKIGAAHKNSLIILGVLLLVGTIVRGPAMFALSYSNDDFALLSLDSWVSWEESRWLSMDGRHFARLVTLFFDRFGSAYVGASGVYAVFFHTALCFFALAVTKIWKIKSIAQRLVVCIAIVFFPYNSELFTFKYASLKYGFCFFLVGVALLLSPLKLKSGILIMLLLLMAFATYQPIAGWVASSILIAILLNVLSCKGGEKGKQSEELKPYFFLGLIAISSVIFLLLNKIYNVYFTLPQDKLRSSLLPLNQLENRLNELFSYIVYLLNWDFLIPHATRFVLLLLAVFLFLGGFIRFLKREEPHFVFKSGASIVLLFLAFCAAIAPVAMVDTWHPNPRSISGLSIIWACIVCLALQNDQFSRNWFQRFSYGARIICVLAILFSFLLVSNRSLLEKLRVNSRDKLFANRIYARMEEHPDFSKIKRLAVVGFFDYPHVMATTKFTMNTSAFKSKYSNVSIFSEISGKKYFEPDISEKAFIYDFARKLPVWPDKGCIQVIDDLMVIKISESPD